VASQGLTNFNLTRVGETGYGGLVLSASSESVSVLIRALQECRRIEVLARPQIMTLDNQPSYIQVGQRVPRISASTISTVGQSNSIAEDNVGLILGVTPRVSPEDLVVMEIDAERSELGPVDEGIPVAFSGNNVIRSPVINLAMAQTTVSAADGETIVLGGLINKNTTAVRRRVPGLSSIPVLGYLFRYDDDSIRREELLIILTPHIVRTTKDAERMKQLEAARMHWCLADVHDVHGPTGIAGTQIIYPDKDPRGAKPTMVPAGQTEPQNMDLMPVPERAPPEPVLPEIDFPSPNPSSAPGAGRSGGSS
jgi:type II secretory pathway component GspD/PulD (secretin)